MTQPELYLDHAASAPLLGEARDALLATLDLGPGNPSSAHGAGRRLRDALETAREQVAALVAARPDQVVFTSGATESNTLAILGALAARPLGHTAPGRAHVVGSAADHESTGRLLDGLDARGLHVCRVPVDRAGRVALDGLSAAVTTDTRVVTVPHGQSVTGARIDPARWAAALRGTTALLHLDAAQTAGRCSVVSGDVDLLTLSGHKLGAPQGIGALVIRPGSPWTPPAAAATQERGRRGGTPAVALAAAFGAACVRRARELDERERTLCELSTALRRALLARGDVELVTPEADAVPGVCAFAVDACPGDALLAGLDALGVRVSTGSACASGARVPPPVLVAGGRQPEGAARVLRVSFGDGNTALDVDRFAAHLAAVATRVRSALSTG